MKIFKTNLFSPYPLIQAYLQVIEPVEGALASESEEIEVSPPEDLMREHGILERLLMVYEDAVNKADTSEHFDSTHINRAATLISEFIENHHEKNEEQYIFPLFHEANRLTGLVDTLVTQHERGREATKNILFYSHRSRANDEVARKELISLCKSVLLMLRPHMSRENSVLFPALYMVASKEQIEEIGEKMEEEEHRLLGRKGYGGLLERVFDIERSAGTYDLSRYTPR
jgi:hemerythrin-like domain-containing protein